MGYASTTDINKRVSPADIIRLTDDAVTGSASDTIIVAAIADADAEIDASLGSRYSLPLAATPAIVTRLAAEIAIYLLYLRRGAVPDDWKKRYEHALELLTGIKDGEISIAGLAEASQGTISYDKTEDDKIFTASNMGGFLE